MSFCFAIEFTRLHAGMVDILIRFVIFPQPANYLVAGMERGLLAFNTGVFGGNLFKVEVLGRGTGDFVGPGGIGPRRGLALEISF